MTDKILLENIARFPKPGTEGPRKFTFTADNKRIFYLSNKPRSLVLQLWVYDLQNGTHHQLTHVAETEVSEAQLAGHEKLRRERSRTRELGVTDYQLAEKDNTLVILISLNGWLYCREGEGSFHRLEGSQGVISPQLSPDGKKVAFVRDDNLYLLDLAKPGEPVALTMDGGSAGISNGLAEYVAQEEIGRMDGFWWSPDSQQIAFTRVDNSPVPPLTILHQGQEAGRGQLEEPYYPFAGEANVRLELGVVRLPENNSAAVTRWLSLNPKEETGSAERPTPLSEEYLARVAWRSASSLTAQVETRDQKSLSLLAYDLDSGQRQTLLEEKGEPWLNLHGLTTFLKSGEIIWGSERDGYRHLYLLDAGGKLIRQLTRGEWMVTEMAGVDQDNRVVYFSGTKSSPLERHLYAVSLDGSEPAQLTRQAGWHEAELSPDWTWVLDRWNSLEQPVKVELYPNTLLPKNNEKKPVTLYENPVEPGVKPPELVSFPAEDGTTLYGAIYRPEKLKEGRRYPLIVAVYGGPGAQQVTNKWDMTVDFRAQYLAQAGFVVFKLDNRGSANRGLAFEGALAGRFGEVELRDQLTGVKYMAGKGYIDENRVGIYGWSYGGYMTCIALLKAPEVFKAGVAGAPPTFWEGYDTFYTERYLGHPAQNPEGYASSAVLPLVENLQGKLMLVHGLVDENVHFRHSVALIQRLAETGKDFELVVFPEGRHMLRKPASLAYLEQRLTNFFKQHLI
jgi:dipeptidyl-peptidase-4